MMTDYQTYEMDTAASPSTDHESIEESSWGSHVFIAEEIRILGVLIEKQVNRC